MVTVFVFHMWLAGMIYLDWYTYIDMTWQWNAHCQISFFLHSSFKYQIVLVSSIMMISAGAATSISTSIFTSSGTVFSEEKPVITPGQQTWIQSLLADMSRHDPPTPTTSTTSSTAVALSLYNRFAAFLAALS